MPPEGSIIKIALGNRGYLTRVRFHGPGHKHALSAMARASAADPFSYCTEPGATCALYQHCSGADELMLRAIASIGAHARAAVASLANVKGLAIVQDCTGCQNCI